MDHEREDGHTLLFMQPTDDVSRMYADYKTKDDAFHHMCQVFEETYKRKTKSEEVVYDIDDVVAYYAAYADMILMEFDAGLGHYAPHGKEWVMRELDKFGKEENTTSKTTNGRVTNGTESEDPEFEEDWE